MKIYRTKKFLTALLASAGMFLSAAENPVFEWKNGSMTGREYAEGKWHCSNGAWESSGSGWESLTAQQHSARKEVQVHTVCTFAPEADGYVGVQFGTIYANRDQLRYAYLYHPAKKEFVVASLKEKNGKFVLGRNAVKPFDAKGGKLEIRVTPAGPLKSRVEMNGRYLGTYQITPVWFRSGMVTLNMKAKFMQFRVETKTVKAEFAAFGDSITHHCRWQDAVGKKINVSISNAGLACENSEYGLKRFQTDVLALHPRVVFILTGTNNRKPVTALNDIRQMVILLRKHKITPVLCELLPRGDAHDVRSFNQALAQYVQQEKILCVDWFHVLADEKGRMKKEYGGGVHPNQAGVNQMADYLLSKPELKALFTKR